MCKRVISLFLAVAMIFCFVPLSAFADEHQHTFENKHGYDLNDLPDGYSIPFTIYESPCSGDCGYSEYSWNVFGISGQFVDKTGTSGLNVYKHYREWFESIYGKNAQSSGMPSGIGRKDLPGYAGDNGTPSISPEGYMIYELKPYFWIETNDTRNAGFYPEFPYFSYDNEAMRQTAVAISGNTFYCDEKFSTSSIGVAYGMVAPITGVYKIYKHPSVRSYSFTTSSGTKVNGNLGLGAIGYFPSCTSENSAVTAGNNVVWHYGKYKPGDTSSMFEMTATPLYVQVVSRTTNLTVQNDITINNNTWNGNIYVDNSNNLTYIYPQYTTINENNETITNISTNPIIYNEETKQYYTYDTVTNNYYYITYEPQATPYALAVS